MSREHPIRVALVDDHASARQPLAILLEREPDIAVVAQAGSLVEARAALARTLVDVAVVDLGLPDGDGADLLRELRVAHPRCALLALAATQAETDRARAVAADVPVLCKTSSLAPVLAAIRGLAELHERRRAADDAGGGR